MPPTEIPIIPGKRRAGIDGLDKDIMISPDTTKRLRDVYNNSKKNV